MFLSILIPIYRVQKYIERCAVSLFEQTLQNDIEFIFVDDCSDDESVNILMRTLDRYPKRKAQVLLLKHSKNRGLAASRQTALSKASGNYVLTVDSDDWLELNACEVLQKIALRTGADIVMFDHYVNYASKQYYYRQESAYTGLECLELLFKGKMHGGTCTKLIKRKLYLDNKIAYIEGLNMFEDISVVFRLFYFAQHIEYISQPLYHYFQGNAHSYCTLMLPSSCDNILDLLHFMKSFFVENKIPTTLLNSFNYFYTSSILSILMSVDSFALYQKYTKYLSCQQNSDLKEMNKTRKLAYLLCKKYPTYFSYSAISVFRLLRNVRNWFYNKSYHNALQGLC